jgi:hypothetical protein
VKRREFASRIRLLLTQVIPNGEKCLVADARATVAPLEPSSIQAVRLLSALRRSKC